MERMPGCSGHGQSDDPAPQHVRRAVHTEATWMDELESFASKGILSLKNRTE